MKLLKFGVYILFFLLIFCGTSCKKDKLLGNGTIEFSSKKVLFDTVFTTLGSATQRFLVYNKNKNRLSISSIRLMGGSSSPFRINVNGDSGIEFPAISMEGGDSMFVFVDVKLNVNNQNYPMVIEDSIEFMVNGTAKYVNLIVWGQDVYIHNQDISSVTTWPNDKPHLVYGYTAVDSAKSLTIQAGTKIYFYKNAMFLVYKGSLNVQGTKDNKVQFLNSRLEPEYSEAPGQWYGIRFVEALPSSIQYAVIKNGQVGVEIDSTGNTGMSYTLELGNSEIYNQSSVGIYSVAGAAVNVYNTVVNNCASASVYLYAGGAYNFNYCTFANYTTVSRTTPLFILQNWFQNGSTAYVRAIPQGVFHNCVFYGPLEQEYKIDTISGTTLALDFQNCLFKGTDTVTPIFQNCIFNQDPAFYNSLGNDFHIYSTSSLIGKGNNDLSPPFDKDIEEHTRSTPTDVGAYDY